MLLDSLNRDNSIGVFLSETWLNDGILDAEVTLEGFNLFRGDREGRARGGSALYLREYLNGRKAKSFSNGVVEYVIVTSKVLEAIFISIYRPPDTSYNEWNNAVSSLMEEVDLIQSNGGFQRVLLGGDLNFRDLVWDPEGELVIHQNMGKQQELLHKVCSKLFLNNWVDKATREDRILDVVLSNDRELLLKCEVEVNLRYSDHNLVKLTLTTNCEVPIKHTDNLKYPLSIPHFNWRQGSDEDWTNYTNYLNGVDWCQDTQGMEVENKIQHLYNLMEAAVEATFKSKTGSCPKRRLPNVVRKLWERKSKVSKKILKTKCPRKMIGLREEFLRLEDSLSESYERFRYRREVEIIGQLSENPSKFYNYARSKSVVQSSIGPIKDKDGVLFTDRKQMSEILGQQYYYICQDPFQSLEDPEFLDSLNDSGCGML